MLQVYGFALPEALRTDMMQQFRQEAARLRVSVRLEDVMTQPQELQETLECSRGIGVFAVYVTRESLEQEWMTRLLEQLNRRSRECYILYFCESAACLGTLAQHCRRPYVLAALPVTEQWMTARIRGLLMDYQGVIGDGEAADHLVFQVNGAHVRLRFADILFFEALDKKVTVCTTQHVYSTYASLGLLAEQLKGRFLRCHRSYIVNCDHVEAVDLHSMQLTLRNGARIPVSRSARPLVRRLLDEGGAEGLKGDESGA